MNSEKELKNEICRTLKTIFQRGFISALGGNVSGRLPGDDVFWITPGRRFKGDIRPQDLIKMDLDGTVVEGKHKPSKEWPTHSTIYRCRQDVNAVVHGHNPITIGLSLAGIELDLATAQAFEAVRKIRVVPFAPPGSSELATLVKKRIDGIGAFILSNHGVIALGRDVTEAEAVLETVEEAAINQWVVLTLGGKRKHLQVR